MNRIAGISLAIAMASLASQVAAADSAKDQLNRAPRQSGNVTFDGARGSSTTTGGSSPMNSNAPAARPGRTPEQAIQDYRDSSRTTPEQQRAIENYRNSGKSRSGQ
jgi:hypothetical protein